MKHTCAFTLIELTVVIVIIALLTGGVLTGQSLIRAGELRSVMSDASSYISAFANYRDQYRYLPGDHPKAETHWGAANTDNGNGDGQILGDERYTVWQHLKLAGYVNVSYTGADAGATDFVFGTNLPASKVKAAGFAAYYAGDITATTKLYAAKLGNTLTFGKPTGGATDLPTSAAVTPLDALQIDSKADDGVPGRGKWIANGTGGGDFGATTSCTTDANGNTFTGTYRGTNEAVSCGFFIVTGL